ncbi:MAG TPA: hypothetical protein VK011_01015 [Acidimicrobiia bacterium]|nr:hypothetical protein [Acidimicrobiia bacterium]
MSKTPAQKMFIRPKSTVWVGPSEHLETIGDLGPGVETASFSQADTAVLFVEDSNALREALGEHADELHAPGMLWIAYPKGNRSDINRDTLWPYLTEYGMRPITQISIDERWSALRFRPLLEGEPPFTGGKGQ